MLLCLCVFSQCKESREKSILSGLQASQRLMRLLCEETDFASPRSLVDRETFLSGKQSEAVGRDGTWRALGMGRGRGRPEMDSNGAQRHERWPSRKPQDPCVPGIDQL